MMTLRRLEQLWVRFAAELETPLLRPRLQIRVLQAHQGLYEAGTVSMRPDASAWWAFHEFAHHLSDVRQIGRHSLGARFLAAARLSQWDIVAEERFADTLTFLVTGHWRRRWRRYQQAAEVLRVLLRSEE